MNDSTLPLVTMVSVFYNRAYCANKSVQSMVDQTYPNLEIILVDDCSTDDTLQELRKFEGERVTVITHENMGFTKSIIGAIKNHSKGELIAIHGSGDISFPDRVMKQVEYMGLNPDTGAVACGCEVYSEKSKESHYVARDFTIEKNQLLKRHSNIFSQGEVMMRRSAYSKVGGYRPEFVYAQDYDLWLRINEVSNVARFSEILYLEFGRLDGVRNSIDKAVKQKKFSQLAMHSAYSRIQGKDALDSLQDDVFAPLEGSVPLSERFARLALREMASGDLELSEAYIREAAHYNNGLKVKFINYLRTTTFLLALLRWVRKIRLDLKNRKNRKFKNMNA